MSENFALHESKGVGYETLAKGRRGYWEGKSLVRREASRGVCEVVCIDIYTPVGNFPILVAGW